MSAYDSLLASFPPERQEAFTALFEKYSMTQADRLQFLKDSADLELFQEKDLLSVLDMEKIDSRQAKRRAEELMSGHVKGYVQGEIDADITGIFKGKMSVTVDSKIDAKGGDDDEE